MAETQYQNPFADLYQDDGYKNPFADLYGQDGGFDIENVGRGVAQRAVDVAEGFSTLMTNVGRDDQGQVKYGGPMLGVPRSTLEKAQVEPSFYIGDYGFGIASAEERRKVLNVDNDLDPFAAAKKKLAPIDTGYRQGTTWEKVKDQPLDSVIPFIAEQGLVSIPDMAAALATFPGYVMARTGELGEQRAQNDERQNPTVEDFVTVLPASAASAFLERLGGRTMLGLEDAAVAGGKELLKQSGKAALVESGGEAIDEFSEYTATTLGTKKDFDLAEGGERALAGAVGGLFGGPVRAVTGGIELGTRRAPAGETNLNGQDLATVPDNVTQDDIDSPIPTDVISEGRAILDEVLGRAPARPATAINQALAAREGQTSNLGLDINAETMHRGAPLAEVAAKAEELAPGRREQLQALDQAETVQRRVMDLEAENRRIENLMSDPEISGPQFAEMEIRQSDNDAQIEELRRSAPEPVQTDRRALKRQIDRAFQQALKQVQTNRDQTVFRARQQPVEAPQAPELAPPVQTLPQSRPANWQPLYDDTTGEVVGQINEETGETRFEGQADQVQAPVAAPVDFRPQLESRLEQLGLKGRVALDMPEKIAGVLNGETFEANGRYTSQREVDGIKRIIEVSRNADAPVNTLNHEAVHAMREMGLFNKSEWTALTKSAMGNADLMARMANTTQGLEQDIQTEEAVAQLYADWSEGRTEVKGFVRKAFERVRSMFNAVRESLGLGVSGQEALSRVERGQVGARQEQQQPLDDRMASLKRAMRSADESLNGDTQEDAVTRYQRKGMTSIMGKNFGEPEASSMDILLNDQLPLFERISQAASKEARQEIFDRLRTAMQDDMLPVLKLQNQIEQKVGRELPEMSDTYLQNTLMTGKVGAKLERLNDQHVEPLFRDMQDKNVTQDELETYLYARHAKERNAYISSINSKFKDGEGSGMTDAEADAIMRGAEQSGKTDALKALASRVDTVIRESLDARVRDGLLANDEAQALRQRWKHYVPLRGREELDPTLSYSVPRVGKGSGITAKGKEFRTAFGRKSKAVDILPYVFMQAQESIVRGETNRVAQSFYELAEANPNEDFWTTQKITMKPHIDRKTGEVKYRALTQVNAEDAPYTVVAKIGGEEKRVILNRENPAAARVADAMRKISAQDMAAWVRVFGSFNRYLSMVNTQLNPEFVISNAFRDLQTGLINAQQFDQKGLTKAVLKDYLPAMKAATKGAFKKSDGGEWAKWYREYVDEGGRVYFNKVDDIASLRKSLQRTIDMAKPGLSLRKALNKTGQFVENVNLGVESAIRLATYKNLRQAGMSKARAAAAAKNLTVNFNRKGKIGPFMNSLYLFYNASLQGTATMLIAAHRSSKVRKALTGMVALGVASEIYNQMVGGEDDDGEKFYDKLSEFDKSRNLIIMMPGSDEHIKIPLAYGANFFTHLGRAIVEMTSGSKDAMSAGGDLLVTGVDAFNPLGGTNNLLNLVAPTVVDPLVDLERNRDFADRPIVPEQIQFGPQTPDNQRKFKSVSPAFDAITRFLNDATGGTAVEPGSIDVSPETLEYLFGVATGSAGRTLERSVELPVKLLDPDSELTSNDIPMFRRVFGKKPSWYDKSMMYERTNDIEQQHAYYRDYLARGDKEAAKAFYEEHKNLFAMRGAGKAIRRQLSDIRKQIERLDQMKTDGKMNREDYSRRLEKLRERENMLITRFNKAYVDRVLKAD